MCTRKFESVPTVWTHLHDTVRRAPDAEDTGAAATAGGGGGERLELLLLLLAVSLCDGDPPPLVSPLEGDGDEVRRALPRRVRRGGREAEDGDGERDDGR